MLSHGPIGRGEGGHRESSDASLSEGPKERMHRAQLRSGRLTKLQLDLRSLSEDLDCAERFSYHEPYSEFVCGRWQSCMLWNESGDANDSRIADHQTAAVMTSFGKQLRYVSGMLTSMFHCEHLRFARLARVLPGTVLVPHRDYLELSRPLLRIHIPLRTDERSFLSEGSLVYRMNVGEMWFLDATQLHSAASYSSSPRVHLILDFRDGCSLVNISRTAIDEQAGIPEEAIVSRPALSSSDLEGILALHEILDEDNYRDILAILIRKHFSKNCDASAIFDWLSQIAQRSGKSALIDRADRDANYFMKYRELMNAI